MRNILACPTLWLKKPILTEDFELIKTLMSTLINLDEWHTSVHNDDKNAFLATYQGACDSEKVQRLSSELRLIGVNANQNTIMAAYKSLVEEFADWIFPRYS